MHLLCCFWSVGAEVGLWLTLLWSQLNKFINDTFSLCIYYMFWSRQCEGQLSEYMFLLDHIS